MTVAENLLRLHRWQLDERRRYVAELESLAERLRADVRRLIDEIDADRGMTDQSAHADPARCPVSRLLIGRRRKLEHSVLEIQEQIVEARAAIVTAEHEVQIWELAAAQRTSAGGGAIAWGFRPPRSTPPTPFRARRHGS